MDLNSATPATPIKLGFSLKQKPKTNATAPQQPTASLFLSLDDDETHTGESAKTGWRAPGQLVATEASMNKSLRKQLEEQEKINPYAFEYDEVWDRMKDAERQAQLAKEEEAKIRKPKYISSLLQAADIRKLDHLRAEEKMIQRERAQEGDEFVDKEKFVTDAYKEQLAAIRKAEEEEKAKAELAKKRKPTTTGMAHFYQTWLQQSSEKHATAMAAVSKPLESLGGPNFAIRKPDDLAPQAAEKASDLELARVAQAQGKHVELNDDNQIIDKRELLSAGLNLSGKNTRDLASLRKSRTSAAKDQPAVIHTAVGAAAGRREIEQRRRHELERQVAEEEVRLVEAARQAEGEARERQLKRRNDDQAVQSALDRFRERKRRKLESSRGDQGAPNE